MLYRAIRSYFNSYKEVMKQALTTKNNQSNLSKYVWYIFDPNVAIKVTKIKDVESRIVLNKPFNLWLKFTFLNY